MSSETSKKQISLHVILLAIQILLPIALYFALEWWSPLSAWAIAVVFLINMLAMVGLT